MNSKSIIITIISNIITVCICIYLLKQIELNKNDWEKARELNLTDIHGSFNRTYNISEIINNNHKLCSSLQK